MYELGLDLLLFNGMRHTLSRGKKQAAWKPLFWPEYYVKEGHSMRINNNHLGMEQLRKLAKRVTKYRSHLIKNAK